MKKIGRKCKKDFSSCLALGAGVALAAYIALEYAGNTEAQRECILDCVPSNWDKVKYSSETPQYHTEESIPSEIEGEPHQPLCTGGDCDTFCKTECEKLHPTTPVGLAKEALFNAADTALDSVFELAGIDPEKMTSNVVNAARWGLGIIIALIVLYVGFKFSGFGGKSRSGDGSDGKAPIYVNVTTPASTQSVPASGS